MFRTQNNVPEYYVNKSRDFQLLCRLKDALFGSVKYSIDSLTHTANTREINSTLLGLLKTKVGFFSNIDLNDEQLRMLLRAFPSILRNKGTELSIYQVMHVFFRMKKLDSAEVYIVVDHKNHLVNIALSIDEQDLSVLDDLMSYIIPTGYELNYEFAEKLEPYTNSYNIVSETEIEHVDDTRISKVQNKNIDHNSRKYNMVGLSYVSKPAN